LRNRITFAPVHNPIDTTGLILDDPTLLPDCLDALCEEGEIDAVVGFYAGMGTSDAAPAMLSALSSAVERHPRVRQVACVLCKPEVRTALIDAGVAVFEDPDRAIQAVAIAASIAEGFGKEIRSGMTPALAPDGEPGPSGRVQTGLALDSPPSAVNEWQASQALATLGIPIVQSVLVRDASEAVRAAEDLGFPVVLKVVSAALPHKSDQGGVRLDLGSAEQVRAAFDAMLPPANPRLIGIPIEGILVAPMVRGTELIMGLHRDPVFGLVVMAGSGGIHAEWFSDRALRLAPVGRDEALEMLRELRIFRLLEGVRGQAAADLDAAAGMISRLSRIEPSPGVSSIELNPVIVKAAGEGALAVDCLII
jgi:acyl-CoA synthetase (NDP forming)